MMGTNVDTSVITIPHIAAKKVADPLRQAAVDAQHRWLDDPWVWVTLLLATAISISALLYFSAHHDILLYNDAHSHLDIARRVFDNYSPGLAQLGGVWLPLPHVVMLPFVWNDFLWSSGLAGSFPSMVCYVVAAIYLYLAAKRLTGDGLASVVGTLAFLINPNVLYLQATPLSEMVLLATMAATCYYLVVWAQDDRLGDLVALAVATFLATLARYDGWALFLACLVLIILIGWRKRFVRSKIIGSALLYAMVGGLGIALWFVWCRVIFGDALYFQHSQYSAQTQQQGYIQSNLDPMYHNLPLSAHNVVWLAGETIGPVLLAVLGAALMIYLLRSRLRPQAIAATAFLVPTVFYVVAYYTGQAIMYAPGAAPAAVVEPWFNTRYGITIIMPLAIFLATLAKRWPLGQIAITAVIIGQSFFIARGGIVTLQDGQFGVSCFRYTELPVFLAQHYDGGYILNDTYHTAQDYAGAGIALHNVVYQGSGDLWQHALVDPVDYVDWVVTIPGDLVDQHISKNPAFSSEFTLLLQDPISGVYLYHRVGLPPLPTRALPANLARNDYPLCHAPGQ
jgi:hypothetical protein